jgi:hypothetical protein
MNSAFLTKTLQFWPLTDYPGGFGVPFGRHFEWFHLYRLMRNGGTTAVSPDVPNVLGREAISFEQYTKDFTDSWK